MDPNLHTQGSEAVEAYVAGFSGEVHDRLVAMRATIRQIAPQATEGINYGLVGYKLAGKPLVYFGGFPNHVGFYATPNAHEAFKKEFASYKQGKGSVQFPHSKPLPLDLIKEVVRFKLKQA